MQSHKQFPWDLNNVGLRLYNARGLDEQEIFGVWGWIQGVAETIE